jgi:hypothetical protein
MDIMKFIRRGLLAVAATVAVFAVAAPVASASDFTWPSPNVNTIGGQLGPQGCGNNAPAGVGTAGGTTGLSCGAVLSFIGPAIGQVATVIGPTVIGSAVLAPVITSAGPAQN